jgi:hypothetical protein
MEPTIVGANVDTWILNVHGTLSCCDLDGQPPLREGERVVLYDADGLEVEATVEIYVTARGEQVLVAAPDEATWHDRVPQDIPLPPAEAS